MQFDQEIEDIIRSQKWMFGILIFIQNILLLSLIAWGLLSGFDADFFIAVGINAFFFDLFGLIVIATLVRWPKVWVREPRYVPEDLSSGDIEQNTLETRFKDEIQEFVVGEGHISAQYLEAKQQAEKRQKLLIGYLVVTGLCFFPAPYLNTMFLGIGGILIVILLCRIEYFFGLFGKPAGYLEKLCFDFPYKLKERGISYEMGTEYDPMRGLGLFLIPPFDTQEKHDIGVFLDDARIVAQKYRHTWTKTPIVFYCLLTALVIEFPVYSVFTYIPRISIRSFLAILFHILLVGLVIFTVYEVWFLIRGNKYLRTAKHVLQIPHHGATIKWAEYKEKTGRRFYQVHPELY